MFSGKRCNHIASCTLTKHTHCRKLSALRYFFLLDHNRQTWVYRLVWGPMEVCSGEIAIFWQRMMIAPPRVKIGLMSMFDYFVFTWGKHILLVPADQSPHCWDNLHKTLQECRTHTQGPENAAKIRSRTQLWLCSAFFFHLETMFIYRGPQKRNG